MKISINEWADKFVKLFKRFSPTELNIPKLHHWVYHTIPSIRMFGAINGFSAETYETLHKYYVKNLYKMTNKHNTNPQMIRMVSNL